MRFQVIPLRDRGRVLRRSELQAPVSGTLIIEDWPAPNALRRGTRRAQILGGQYSVAVSLLPALFDPQLVRADESGIYIAGVELDSTDDSPMPAEHIQIWMCLPETQKGPTPAP